MLFIHWNKNYNYNYDKISLNLKQIKKKILFYFDYFDINYHKINIK